MRRPLRNIGVGTMSLVMIFAVLCLTVFAMLTLSTANAEKIMAEKTAAFVKAYYEADSRATQIRAQVVAAADAPPTWADGIEIRLESTETVDDAGVRAVQYVQYTCPVGEAQELFVRFLLDGVDDRILNWELRLAGDWAPDARITIWEGGVAD